MNTLGIRCIMFAVDDIEDIVVRLRAHGALEALESDPQTKVIAVVSKLPGKQTLARLMERFQTYTKPIVGCFVGMKLQHQEQGGTFRVAHTIDETVRLAMSSIREEAPHSDSISSEQRERITREVAAWSPDQKYLRGVFAGGTFCYQSQQIFQDAGITVHSNAPLEPQHKLADSDYSVGHTIVDMGADEYTVGRPHPMIDRTLRKQRTLAESSDPETAIVLLDFILGYNASMDPVGELLDSLEEAKQIVERRGGKLTVVASVCGTDSDAQIIDLQIKMVEDLGVVTFLSNAKAAAFCCTLLEESGEHHVVSTQ